MGSVSPIDVLNYCIQHSPGSLGLFALSQRVCEVKFKVRPVKSGGCYHRPSGEEDIVGVIGCECREIHSAKEKCSACGQFVPYHDFPSRRLRVAMVTVELPEAVGVNLKGPEEGRDFIIAFTVDRAIFDRLERQAASGLVLPPGAQI